MLKLAEKHGRVTDRGCTIALARIPESLAEMVASTAGHVEGLLHRWESEGLIVVGTSELTVLDMDSLRRSLEYMKERAW